MPRIQQCEGTEVAGPIMLWVKRVNAKNLLTLQRMGSVFATVAVSLLSSSRKSLHALAYRSELQQSTPPLLYHSVMVEPLS